MVSTNLFENLEYQFISMLGHWSSQLHLDRIIAWNCSLFWLLYFCLQLPEPYPTKQDIFWTSVKCLFLFKLNENWWHMIIIFLIGCLFNFLCEILFLSKDKAERYSLIARYKTYHQSANKKLHFFPPFSSVLFFLSWLDQSNSSSACNRSKTSKRFKWGPCIWTMWGA